MHCPKTSFFSFELRLWLYPYDLLFIARCLLPKRSYQRKKNRSNRGTVCPTVTTCHFLDTKRYSKSPPGLSSFLIGMSLGLYLMQSARCSDPSSIHLRGFTVGVFQAARAIKFHSVCTLIECFIPLHADPCLLQKTLCNMLEEHENTAAVKCEVRTCKLILPLKHKCCNPTCKKAVHMGCYKRIVLVTKDKDPNLPCQTIKLIVPKLAILLLPRLIPLTTVALGALTATVDPKIRTI